MAPVRGAGGLVDASQLVSFFANGIVLGSIIALAAIGLTLVYGILNLPNFAHGDYVTLGAYGAFFFVVTSSLAEQRWVTTVLVVVLVAAAIVDDAWFDRLTRTERGTAAGVALPLLLALIAERADPAFLPSFVTHELFLAALLAMALVAVFSVAMEYLVWRPLRQRNATIVTFIIVSIGLALALRNVLAVRFGSELQDYGLPLLPALAIGPVRVTQFQILTVALAGLLVGAVHVVLKYSRVGKALRAIGDNMDLARVSGVDVDRMVVYLWLISGALCGVAGVLLALNVNVNPNLGWNLLLPIFAAVILGGIGSAYGALLGSFAIGVAMELSVAWIPEYRTAVGFGILILVLLIRPQGILGGKVR